jgi:hypothetical protein
MRKIECFNFSASLIPVLLPRQIGGLFRTGPSMLREVLEPPDTIVLPDTASDAAATAALLENLFKQLEVGVFFVR